MERRGFKKFFRSHGSRGGATITTREYPAYSKEVLNCSGNANRAELSRAVVPRSGKAPLVITFGRETIRAIFP